MENSVGQEKIVRLVATLFFRCLRRISATASTIMYRVACPLTELEAQRECDHALDVIKIISCYTRNNNAAVVNNGGARRPAATISVLAWGSPLCISPSLTTLGGDRKLLSGAWCPLLDVPEREINGSDMYLRWRRDDASQYERTMNDASCNIPHLQYHPHIFQQTRKICFTAD